MTRARFRITRRHLLLAPPVPPSVAIVVDGSARAVIVAGPRGVRWAVPHDLLGRLLDVVAAGSGTSLIGGPVPFAPHRRVAWGGWSREGRLISGRFAIEGPAAVPPSLPIAVELWADGVRYGAGFAAADAGRYAFRIALDRLPPGEADLVVRPRLAGLEIGVAMAVPAAAFGHVGFLEPSEPWRVRGWAAARSGPDPVEVALLVDGRAGGTARAALMRADVAGSGFGDGRAGFEIALPADVPLHRPVLLDVRVAPDGPSLAGSPFLRPAAPPVLGFFDVLDGGRAIGWAMAVASPDPVRVEALCDGAVIGSAVADLHRGDLAEAGLPRAACGFHVKLGVPPHRLLGRDVVVRVGDTVLSGSPRRVTLNPNVARVLARRVPEAAVARLRRRWARGPAGPQISILMPVFDTHRAWLQAALDSVRAQWSPRWELICVDDGSRASHVGTLLDAAAAADGRIRVVRLPGRRGIGHAINAGLRAATGEYVAFLDHDDTLEPHAVRHLSEAARDSGADLLYSDEAVTGVEIDEIIDVRARPAFSHDYYLSHPYFVHLVCVRTAVARAVGGYDEAMPISADVDFVLRVLERARAVAHLPRVLYRWRTHEGSAGHARADAVMAATAGAIGRHLRRLGHGATVGPGDGFNQFRVDWPDDRGETLIVIPTRNRGELLRQCLDSVERTTDGAPVRIVVVDHQSTDGATLAYLAGLRGRHEVMPYRGAFNFARMNDLAVRRHGGDARYLLFLNNDVEALTPGWLGRLRSLAGRPGVGAVGPLLLYGNGRVQHAGAIVGFAGAADHALRFLDPRQPDGSRSPGPNCALTAVRDVSAVTAACMMVRREAFDAIGGFDTRFANGFNDTDLCLRLRQAGSRVLYDGQTVLMHHESVTRSQRNALLHPKDDALLQRRWARYFAEGDPFYSPLLAAHGTDHLLRSDLGWKGRQQLRLVHLRAERNSCGDQPSVNDLVLSCAR